MNTDLKSKFKTYIFVNMIKLKNRIKQIWSQPPPKSRDNEIPEEHNLILKEKQAEVSYYLIQWRGMERKQAWGEDRHGQGSSWCSSSHTWSGAGPWVEDDELAADRSNRLAGCSSFLLETEFTINQQRERGETSGMHHHILKFQNAYGQQYSLNLKFRSTWAPICHAHEKMQ
jgi:hypothetical protein